MEPENIGIGYIIQQVHANPEKYAETIARRVARLIIKKLVIAEQEGQTLNDDQLLAVADRIPSQKQIEKMSPIVIQLIQEHARGSTSLAETETPKKRIHDSMRNLVSRACMELLANQLHTHGELAQYIHNHTDLGIRTLHQPERLTMFEHGIIPRNRIFHDIGDENTQLWSGHETQRKHVSGGTRNDNIITLLERDSEQGEFKITALLQGQDVRIFENQILVFNHGTITVYSKPHKNSLENFVMLGKFSCDFESIDNLESFKTRSGWHMHRITGTKNIGEKNEEISSITSSITLCINNENPPLSYATPSKRFIMNGNSFTIDATNGVIVVLTQGDTVKIPYSDIDGAEESGNGEKYFIFNQNGVQKKLTFSGGQPEVLDV